MKAKPIQNKPEILDEIDKAIAKIEAKYKVLITFNTGKIIKK
jgi:hypothetical protein